MDVRLNNFSPEGYEQHLCNSWIEGEWIIFRCPECDYERRMNLESGEMKVKGGAPDVLHSGSHRPVMVGKKDLPEN